MYFATVFEELFAQYYQYQQKRAGPVSVLRSAVVQDYFQFASKEDGSEMMYETDPIASINDLENCGNDQNKKKDFENFIFQVCKAYDIFQEMNGIFTLSIAAHLTVDNDGQFRLAFFTPSDPLKKYIDTFGFSIGVFSPLKNDCINIGVRCMFFLFELLK